MKHILFIGISLLSLSLCAQTTGPNSPAVTENRPPCSCYPGEYYSNIQYANASDDQCVNAVLELRPDCQNDSCFYTRYFYAHGFGFTVPLSAVINGITIQIERSADLPGIVADSVIRMVPMNWAVVGNNYAVPNTFGNTDSVVTYGGLADLWGYPFTVNEINSPDFGVAYIVKNNSTLLSPTLCIDHLQITVDYTLTTGEHLQQISSPEGITVTYDPGNGSLLIHSSVNEPGSLRIRDMAGRLISSEEMKEGKLMISTAGFRPGTYLVALESKGKTFTQKVIIGR